jgi:hypothetical protein
MRGLLRTTSRGEGVGVKNNLKGRGVLVSRTTSRGEGVGVKNNLKGRGVTKRNDQG